MSLINEELSQERLRAFAAEILKEDQASLEIEEILSSQDPALLRVFSKGGRSVLLGLTRHSDLIPNQAEHRLVDGFYAFEGICSPGVMGTLMARMLSAPENVGFSILLRRRRHVRLLGEHHDAMELREVSLKRPMIDAWFALEREGLNHLPAPEETLLKDGKGRVYLFFTEGTSSYLAAEDIAFESLRDYLDEGGDPAEAGANFGTEAQRIGQLFCRLHRAARAAVPALKEIYQEAEADEDAVATCGGLSLNQLARSDAGWCLRELLDVADHPFSTPVKDCAYFVSSLKSFCKRALKELSATKEEQEKRAEAWMRHVLVNTARGYLEEGGEAFVDQSHFEELIKRVSLTD